MIPSNLEIMARLRDETADAHRAAESNPLEQGLFRGALPVPGFVAFLEQRYCVHRVLDEAVGALVKSQPRFAGLIPEALWQTPNLLSDLEFWNARLAEIRALPATAAYCEWVNSNAAKVSCRLLGAYYVFEGSKNGARMLSRVLALAYTLNDGRGLRYMDPHGPEQRTIWNDFRIRMNAIAFSQTEMDEMVEAAKYTFSAVHAIDTEIWSSLKSAHSCCGGACRA